MRRQVLRLAGFAAIIGLAYGVAAGLRRLTEPALEFDPIAHLPGFRKVSGGPISGGATALIGLGADKKTPVPSGGALCDHLFGAGRDPARVQIAYFTDYRCVYCRQVSPLLDAVARARDVQITWHELPLLGPVSTMGARAALAAGEQGAYGAFHTRLMGAPVVPTPAYLAQLARDAGIDPARMQRDMVSEKIDRQLAVSAGLAQRFGFIGTPALVVGRTAVLGGIDGRLLDRLIAAERATPQPAPCG